MATPSPKRRKLDHESSSEEDDSASFASFSDDAEVQEGAEHEGLSDEELDAEEESRESEEEDEEDDSWHDANENQDHNPKSLKKTPSSPKTSKTPKVQDPKQKAVRTSGIHVPGAVKSSAFQAQVDELLEHIRPRPGKRELAVESALHKLKSAIESIPPRGPLSVEEAERQLLMSSKVVIPFPDPRPPQDAKYKLEYSRPTHINVVGSHALKTRPRSKDTVEIDMSVMMSSSLLQDKDFLNYRYFYKRAYFLACIAAGLEIRHGDEFGCTFQLSHDNKLHPVLVVSPGQEKKQDGGKSSGLRWRINVMPCAGPDVFSPDKLRPDRNCVRTATLTTDEDDVAASNISTPFYNSSIRSDMLANAYLKLIHSASKKCPAFQDACLLGNTWLRQRGVGSKVHSGGFGSFELTALMALLLENGASNSRPILSEGYSSYQLWKATLQLLAMKDASKEPLILGPLDGDLKLFAIGSPIVWDASRAHNLLFKMTPWSYRRLRQEARTTLSMLNDHSFDAFEAAFIQRSHLSSFRFDYVLELQDSILNRGNPNQARDALPDCVKIYDVLIRALGERISLINIVPRWSEEWNIGFAKPGNGIDRTIVVGFQVNPETVDRTVDHGPSADNKNEATLFREFWGEKAELRRFKDGSIHESIVWSGHRFGQSILEQIVRYVIGKHISSEVQHSMKFTGDGFQTLFSGSSAEHGPAQLLEAFKKLEHDIRSLHDLPLSVRQIALADAQLRHTSSTDPNCAPAGVVIQFEGSARWPDDLVAIQRTKVAFLLNLSNLLQQSVDEVSSRVGLENNEHDILNQAFLDIVYDSGAAFRLRIHHDREQALLERKLKDKTLDPKSKEVAALGLAKYKRDYLKAPAFTQAISRLCSGHPVMSGSIKLLKKWFARHLLANHIAEETIELLVARTFTQPWPWQPPSSIQMGFLRTLLWISRWDWRDAPLIVDLSGSGDLTQPDYQSINTRFEAWRKLDPLLNRLVLFCASNVDPDGTAWTEGRPQKVIATRMTALAKAACAEVETKQLHLDPASLFFSSLTDFDFIIHLQPWFVRGKARGKQASSNGITFKNLELQANAHPSMRGYDPVKELLRELEDLFGTAVVFFSGGNERPVIAGLWDPSTAARAWKLHLGYSTAPKSGKGDGEVVAEINKDAVLVEIARLGGDMVEKIEVHR